ncbi:hypothetical protein [Helicobacter ganmani]|uniref:Sugar transferase n=3 Tax=Helicobacter ganmani TaxID=60246 RepID=A0A3D8IAP9_9HELI|nr:hypothetical protein [Helicobacter ganmani]RDU61621.1 hypothetical protein CQA43_09070 [Helicobacter ganmani]
MNTSTFLISERTDGLGSRLISLLTTLFLAKKLGDIHLAKFVWEEGQFLKQREQNVNWQGSNEQKIIGASCDKKEKIFSKRFIEKFYIKDYDRGSSLNLCLGRPFRTFKQFQAAFENQLKESFVYGLSDVFGVFSDLTQQDRAILSETFKEIEFCDSLSIIIGEAENQAKNLGNFSALHVRSGDTIYDYSNFRKWNMVSVKHATYAELALNIAKNLKGKVVLVGDDVTSLRKIVEIANQDNILFIENFKSNRNYSNIENFLFDIIFMSRAKRLYGTHSAVVRLAHYIGNQEFINNYSVFSPIEQYEFLQRDYSSLNLSKSQKAFSLFHKMILCEEVGGDTKCLISYAKEAIGLDSANPKFKIYLLKYLILQDLNLANSQAKEYLQEKDFFDTLFVKSENWFGIAYAPLFPNFTKQIVSEYANLSYIASKICEFQKNFEQTLKFAIKSYEKEPQNEMFKEHLFNVLLQKEKEKSSLNKLALKKSSKNNQVPSIYLITAKHRIHNHLAYKLGSAMILNSKSLWGYIRMPYVLSYIKETHRKEIADYEARVAKNPSLKLPPLESYTDYKQALKEKECFTYKLGKALITANSVRGGGRIFAYLQFFQEVRKLKKEFRGKHKDCKFL